MRRPCRPVVSELEGRHLLAGGGVHSLVSPSPYQAVRPFDPQGIKASAISTVPVPGDTRGPLGLPKAAWLKLHQKFLLQARRDHPDVVFLGDSITDRWLWIGAAAWNQSFAPTRAAAYGIRGDQTQNVLWRVLHGELSSRPRVAVVMVGFNNLAQGQSAVETAAGIVAVVDAIRRVSPGTKVLLLGVLPFGPTPGRPQRAQVEQVNASISRLADDSVRYLDVGRRLLRTDGTISPSLMSDYVHPTLAGYQIIAAAIRDPLRALLAG